MHIPVLMNTPFDFPLFGPAFAFDTAALLALVVLVPAGLVVFVFLWNRTLRIRVQEKTAELERKTAEIRELNAQLRISNEELQTSNEEYESANEELQLLNDDLNERNARLAEATEQMRALKDFNEKVIAAVPSALLVVDRHLKVLCVNDKYYSTFPNLPGKAEGSFLPDALPHSLLYGYDILRNIQEVVQTSACFHLPCASYLEEHRVERFFDIHICPVAAEASSEGRSSNVLLVIDDITEMKRLETEITTRERYFRNLVNNSLVAIMTTDSEGNFTLFNEGGERLIGVSAEDACGSPATRIFLRETDFQDIIERVAIETRVENYETEFAIGSEEKIEVSLFATSLRNEKGELTGHLIIATDLRERKRAEQNLIRKNKELSTLYGVGHTLTCSEPFDERLRSVAGQVAAAFGCEVCAIAVCSVEDVSRTERVHAAGAHHFQSDDALRKICEVMTRRVQAEENPFFGNSLLDDSDLRASLKSLENDGSFVIVRLFAGKKTIGSLTVLRFGEAPFQSEDLDLLSSIGQRVATVIENEQLYAGEKENVSRLRALVDATRAIGAVLDPDGVLEALVTQVMSIIPCRHAAALTCGSEMQSLSVIASKTLHQEDALKKGTSLPARGTIIEEILRTTSTCRCSAADEKDCPIRALFAGAGIGFCVCAPASFDGSFALLVLGREEGRAIADAEMHILSDLLVYVSLSVKNARLYTALQTAYADLKKAQEAMVRAERYRAIGELSAGVAHDFNNALSIILGRAQLLMTLTKNQQLLKGLKSIENASRDAASTVRRMQEFSKSISRKPYSRLDINDVARQVLETIDPRVRELAEVGGVRVNVAYRPQEARPVSGDAGELREALTNVVFNAIEAMPRGGDLTVKTGLRGESVFVEVVDTGVGMSPEVEKKVFQPFFTTKPNGMGLGMSLVYGTVKRHGGQVQITSQPNAGTTVTFLFPVDLTTGEVREAAEPTVTRKATVLIVDDSVEVTRTLRQMLESVSHEVTAVTDGEEGVTKYRESRFDIVVTDIGMPGISGWEVSKAIKGYDPEARVILITAWGVQLDEQKVKESGASLVIQKPFDTTRILSAIEELLTRRPPR